MRQREPNIEALHHCIHVFVNLAEREGHGYANILAALVSGAAIVAYRAGLDVNQLAEIVRESYKVTANILTGPLTRQDPDN